MGRLFQSTRPHGARLRPSPSRIRNPLFQSTRPHGARLSGQPRQVTLFFCFNPRARTGRDSIFLETENEMISFNPRARTGRDPYTPNFFRILKKVSIHAPARGATLFAICYVYIYILFQSTRPHGARRTELVHSTRATDRFQSTRPHGARQKTSADYFCSDGFNPRARTGRDSLLMIFREFW